MTTEIFVTNHPETAIIIQDRSLTPAERVTLARHYVTLVDPRDRYNIASLSAMVNSIKDNKTVTTVGTSSDVLIDNQIVCGRNERGQPRRLYKRESLIIMRQNMRDETIPFVTVRRLPQP